MDGSRHHLPTEWRAAALGAILLLAAAAGAVADRVDDVVRAAMKEQHIPGLSLAVVKQGKVVKMTGYGLANVELNVPVVPKTVFKLGSVSKQFIATGIMLLVEDGKVRLDDPIAHFFDGTPASWSGITVRHLLTMTSGLPHESPGWSPFQEATEEQIRRAAYPVPLAFAPGEKWDYCNLGYFLLAQIIHRASGQPWSQFLRERILAPLGMRDTRVTTVAPIIPDRASGYEWQEDRLQNSSPFLTVRPSGAFLSTVIDMVKWDAALSEGGVLKRASLEQMWTPVTLNDGKTYPYGFGWLVEEVEGHKVVRHSGALTGFRAHIARFLQDQVTVIVLTNCGEARPESIAVDVARQYHPEYAPAKGTPRQAAVRWTYSQ